MDFKDLIGERIKFTKSTNRRHRILAYILLIIPIIIIAIVVIKPELLPSELAAMGFAAIPGLSSMSFWKKIDDGKKFIGQLKFTAANVDRKDELNDYERAIIDKVLNTLVLEE